MNNLYTYESKLIRVVDGDTIIATIDLGFNTMTERTIRLYGIDAYESRTTNAEEKVKGIAAKDRLIELFNSVNGEFILKSESLDKYGRSLGVIIINQTEGELNINQTLLNEGHAIEYFGGTR